jgi:sigma-54 dependent transcriptional regulator, acetoin dehydrogenase operon transcriptional activator AcoR
MRSCKRKTLFERSNGKDRQMKTNGSDSSNTGTPDPQEIVTRDGFARLVGRSARFAQVANKARLLAAVNAPVLLHGETGVGKEVFARAIHEHGPLRKAAFVAVNCGALSRELLASELFGYVDGAFTGARRTGAIGKVEAANGGTLFLDEIAEMPLDLQPYLLRVLESGEVCPLGSNTPRKVHFRLIAACNRDLRVEVNSQRFRMDLFYRISVTSLRIPPLRERKDDLPSLVEYFSEGVSERQGSPRKQFSPEVLEVFSNYPWPGNLRELRNVVEAMMLLSEGDTVGTEALPVELSGPAPDAVTPPAALCGLREAERETIGTAIRAHSGNLTLAARDLGVARSTLYLKIKKYQLERTLDETRARAS